MLGGKSRSSETKRKQASDSEKYIYSLPSQKSLVEGSGEERVQKVLMNDNEANDATTKTEPRNERSESRKQIN